MNRLVRLLNSWQIFTNSRTSLSPYQLNAGLRTSLQLSDKATSDSNVPKKPKRPINAYIRFAQSIRNTLHAQNPNASPTDVLKLAAAQWQVLDPVAKLKLEEEFKKEQAVWLQQNAKYLSQLTDEQKDEIRQAREEKTEDKAKRVYRKKVKELGRPKRPLNGFFLFCAELKPKNLNKEENISQLKSLGQKWSQLSEAEKAPYNARAVEGMVKYREEINQWEEKMIAQDHMDVVRRKNIILPRKKESKPHAQ